MKKTLLALLFVSSLSQAQFQVNAYMGQLYNGPMLVIDGVNHRSYNLVANPTPLDQTATGSNQVWNFDALDEIGSVAYGVSAPSSQELALFPNATQILNTNSGNQSAQFVFGNNGGNILGVANPEFELFYTNPADIGTFPLSANHSNTDNVAGSFQYDGNTGTFSGTFNTSIDASGTLMTFAFEEPRAVTRLKTVQNLTLNHPVFGNVGTFSQTIYHYYDNDLTWLWPQFRSTTTTIMVPLLSINETQNVYEMQVQAFLETPDVAQNKTVLYPNPVNNVLNIQTDATIESISVSDLTGKTVLVKKNPGATVDISRLTSGVYIVNVNSGKGSTIKKLIKN